MLPHLNANIRARGVSSPSAAVTHTRSPPLTYEFGVEPDSEIVSQSEVSVFVEGAMTTNQVIDCVRQTYMGKKPHAALQSTR